MRYVVGGGGLAWEAVIDQFKNPMAFLVFGALATATDMFAFVGVLIKQAKEESKGIEREIEHTKYRRGGTDSEI